MPITNCQGKRIEWLDNLKALAIFLVVLGHTGLEGQSEIISMIRTWIYEFHMPLFFWLSGISFSVVLNKDGKSVKKQILNMMLIYIIQSVIYILMNIAVHQFLNIQTQNKTEFSDLYTFLINPIGHFWYLQALIIIYVIEVFLDTLLKDNRIKLVIVAIVVCLGSLTSLGVLSRALYYLLYFECGKRVLTVKKVPIWLSGIGVIASFTLPFILINNPYLLKILAIVIALSTSVFLVSLFSKYFDSNNKITSIGKNCLWIYIFHTYFTSVSRNLCNKVIPTLPIVSMMITTIIGIAGPLIIMYVFNKIGISRIVTKPVSYVWKGKVE